jgi:hypothetical protein
VQTLGAARVEEKIMKVPESEFLVTLGQAKLTSVSTADLEKDLAIEEQREKLDPGETLVPTPLFDLLRGGKHGDGCRNLRIANPEQRARTRRFQHHLVAAPSHIREPRQNESVGVAKFRRLRPIVWNLRFDDDEVLGVSRARKAVLQQTAPNQLPEQLTNLFIGVPAFGLKRAKGQT